MAKHTTRDARAIAADLAAGKPFTTHGSLAGRAERVGPFDSGRLTGADRDAFDRDMSGIDYVVTSYATPIAWRLSTGEWHRVSQRFSVTTSKQQGTVAYALTLAGARMRETAEASR